MVSKKERKVVQLQIGDSFHFFGSVRALCDSFGGLVGNYSTLEKKLWTLRKKGLDEVVSDGVYTIRIGTLVVSQRKK